MILNKFPRTYDIEIWKTYLNRELTMDELVIINNFRLEFEFNKKLFDLYKIVNYKNLYIVKLTNLNGMCLFESLAENNMHDVLKKNILIILLEYKNIPNYFNNNIDTLHELFLKFNETVDENYTYEAMCQDIIQMNETSWTRIPTELILMIISKIYNVKIMIISNLSYNVNEIYEGNMHTFNVIYIGHIDECHYVPLHIKLPNIDYKFIKYENAKNKFYEWAYSIEKSKSII
jgi:hypothetical protein